MARSIAQKYSGLEIGLADALLVLLAQRFDTRRILTLDERAFRTLRPIQSGHFTVLPLDAPNAE